MSRPEEFEIHIEPDGRVVLERGGMSEESYRRIVEFLTETIGPIEHCENEDPPAMRFAASHSAREKRVINQKQQ